MKAIGAAKKMKYQMIAGMASRYFGVLNLALDFAATETATKNQPPAFAFDLLRMSINRSSAGVITCVRIVLT